MQIKYLVREFISDDITFDRFNYLRDKDDQIQLFDSFEQAWEHTDNGLKGFIERIDLSDRYILIDEVAEEGKALTDKNYKVFNLYEILNCINADRSEDWIDYDQLDFEEGLDEFTEFTIVGKLEV